MHCNRESASIPLGDTYVDAHSCMRLWRGRGKEIPVIQSTGHAGEKIWFVSLGWLIEEHPGMEWLKALDKGIKKRAKTDGSQGMFFPS